MNQSLTEPVVAFEKISSRIALITLNRPAARNAVNAAVARELDAIVKQVEADASISVAILTGAGDKAFCAGADLKEIASGAPAHARMTPDGGFAGFVFAPRKKVWIAAVKGAALAGGFEIVLACDLVVASSEATFGLPEVKRGLAAAAGGIFRLPRMIPRNLALEVIATGRAMPAQRAFELGLVNQIVPPDQVLKEAMALAEAISENAPLAVQWSLEIARRALDLDASELRRETAEMSDRLFTTEDAREGPRAFAEKRLPRWTGLAAPTPDS